MIGSHTLFRPPAEANSLILRIMDGCPWNQCLFCGMYKGVKFRAYPLNQISETISDASKSDMDARRIFLADGDVMALDFELLESILLFLNESFPHLSRVGVYANGHSINQKTDAQLKRLKELKLHTLYMGLESGSNAVLAKMKKRESATEMLQAGIKAQSCGLRMSVMILLGLGGKELQAQHIDETINIINQMQPRLLSALRVVPVPNTPLPKMVKAGEFETISEYDVVNELREMIKGFELNGTVFRANHSSNVMPVEARLSRDRDRVVNELKAVLASGRLDQSSPGRMPLFL